MIKQLIFSDLDGTLLEHNSAISQLNKQLITELHQQQSYIIPTTGRSFKATQNAINDFYFPYYICFNGCVITDHLGNHLINYPLSPDLVKRIATYCQTKNISVAIYQHEQIYYNLYSTPLQNYMSHIQLDGKPIEGSNFDYTNCFKIMFLPHSEQMTEVSKQFKQTFANEPVNIDRSGEIRLEIYSQESNKGMAIHWLANHLNCNQDQIIAIGDAENDIEMIKAAHLGIAMGNASDKVKQHANLIADHNNNNGWYKIISQYRVSDLK